MDMDRYIGTLLDGRYEILDVLGTGGMAVVYKARCHRLNRLVAIKILKDELIQDEEFRRRFHAESQAVAALSHPNIVSVYDVSTSDDADYIVMELIDGITLKQYMEKKGVLNWKETLHFAIQIGKALDHAHSRGIIHRDIKPHNVMVLKNGSVKVADFGIAQVMSKSNTLTQEALGSVHYISPEQAKGGRVDNRSDLYSLGVVMYEMMTGRPPYDGDTPVAVAIQHINGKAAMPSTLNPNMPGGLEQIIMKAMAQEPGKRYATATAMLYDMDEFRKDPTILFDYNNTSTGLDDATMIHSAAAINAAAQAAEEKTTVKSGEHPPRNTTPARRPQMPPKKKRRREEIVEDVDRGGRVVTVAIVLCALAVLVAIGLLINMLLSEDSGRPQNQNMITVPNLENKLYSEALEATDYVVKLDVYSYSDVFEKDRIISQEPAANTQIQKGETVYVIVSAGPEPTEKKMEDLVGLDQETAFNFLVKTQGISEDLVAIVPEYSADIGAGLVIRTDPIEGEVLGDGEIIRLYVSKGPETKKVLMVDLTSDFYNEDSAIKWLELNGFTNYEIIPEPNEKVPAGKIFWQSRPAGEYIDVTASVVLRVSTGSATEPTLPPPPVGDPEDYVSKLVDVVFPDGITEDFLVSIYRVEDGTLVEERDIPAGTLYTQFIVTGKGVMEFQVRLSTGESWVEVVDFDTPYVPYEPPVQETPTEPDDEPVISDDPEQTDPSESTDPTESTGEVENP